MAAIYPAVKGAPAPQGDSTNANWWPQGYLPGETDNFVSNEVILQGLFLADVWTNLVTPDRWPGSYPNASEIRFYLGAGPELRQGTRNTAIKPYAEHVAVPGQQFLEPGHKVIAVPGESP